MMALLGCHNEHHLQTNYYSVLDEECPTFEKQFPVKQSMIDKSFTKDDRTWVIEYSSFEEAEWKMVHFFFPDGIPEIRFWAEFDYDVFKNVVLSDTSSMSYPFDSIVRYANITIANSSDGLVRIYTWEWPHIHSASSFETLTQYRWKGKVLIQGEKECDCEYCPSYEARNIYTIEEKGETFYLVSNYIKEWSSLAYMSFDAFVLNRSGLKPIALFSTEDGMVDHIGFEYNIPDWYYRANLGEGYDWLGYYDQINRVYYLPEEDYYLSDRYFQCIFDRDRFVIKKESVGNPFLSPSLSEYSLLVELFETKRNKIRIDLMDDGTYRYAAWKAGGRMADNPELVIWNGVYEDPTSSYVFYNEGYEYRVSDTVVGVYKDRGLVSSWEVYDRWLTQ